MKLKRKVFLFSLLLIFVISSVACANKPSAEDVAKQLLESILTPSQEECDAFDQISSEEDMIGWMSSRYDSFMTEDGMTAGMLNRVLTRGVALAKEGIEIESTSVSEREQSGENWYNYSVEVKGDKGFSFTGSMHFIEVEGKFLCNKITVN